MKPITISEIAAAVGNTDPQLKNNQTKITSVSTDSRDRETGGEASLFVALRGDNFDGHRYVKNFLGQKSAFALVDKKGLPNGDNYSRLIYCKDTEQGFLDLAGWYRDRFNPRIVGVTGSAGKTTTKEMIAQVLSAQFITMKNQGNLNNRVGLPKTLLNLDESIEAAVIEMGMSSFGEISDLTRRTRPDLAVITNIGVAHIEFLGSREGILKAKLEILEGMKPGSPLILCGDDDLLSAVQDDRFDIITFGIDNPACTVRATAVEEAGGSSSFNILYQGKSYPAKLPAFGIHNVRNALAAFAVGSCYGMEAEKIVEALASYTPAGMRQRVVERQEIRVVEDCYNAGPDSMMAAITAFGSMAMEGKFAAGRKILVMGDMLELGDYSEKAHYEAGTKAGEEGFNYILCCGSLSIAAYLGAKAADGDKSICLHFQNNAELTPILLEILSPSDTVWLKASRGMKMEEVLEKIYEQNP